MFLYQPISGYRYNSDSLFLYHFASKFTPKGKMLDVGCGVGILSLLLGRDFDVEISIIDKQESMLAYATHNFALNGLEVQSYLEDFTQFKSEQKFDFVISNPPFYDPRVVQSENTHLNIARYAHHLPSDELIAKVKQILKPRGYFIFCYDAKQVDVLLVGLTSCGINPEVMQFVHSKIDRESKLVMMAARIGSKSAMKILPPLVVFEGEDVYTKHAQQVFEIAHIHSIKGDF